jgi:hypothetical protein
MPRSARWAKGGLRGFEPQHLPAKTMSEMQLLASRIVTLYAIFLRICVGVLRDITVLAYPVATAMSGTGTRVGKPRVRASAPS